MSTVLVFVAPDATCSPIVKTSPVCCCTVRGWFSCVLSSVKLALVTPPTQDVWADSDAVHAEAPWAYSTPDTSATKRATAAPAALRRGGRGFALLEGKLKSVFIGP